MTPLEEVFGQLKFLQGLKGSKDKGDKGGTVRSAEKSAPGASPDPSGHKGYGPGLGAVDAPPEKWVKPEKWYSAGGVVVAGKDDYDHLYIRLPSNNYGPWSFPKGKIDKGESPPKAALREVKEEIGVVAELVPGGYLGTGEGGFSITHYYLMVATHDTHRHDFETEKVEIVAWHDAIKTFASAGNLRDLRITTRALDLVEKLKKQGKVP